MDGRQEGRPLYLANVAALILLFPLFFSLSLALQGPTLAPSLVPDFGNLDWECFRAAFAQEPPAGAGCSTRSSCRWR